MPRMLLVGLLILPALTGCDAVRVRPGNESGPIEIEVAVFEGGYGITWHQKMAAAYSAAHPDVNVNLWGDPRIEEKVKPRLLRGTPPDAIIDYHFPIWLLIAEGKLHDFNDALTKTAPGSSVPWAQDFRPGTLRNYESDGRFFAAPTAFGAYTCWYDAKLFREHGWTPPDTWSEFVALCETIKAAGIAPLAYQGKYPVYAWWTFNSVVQRCGGLAAVNRINALEPGAFRHEDVVWAAELMQELAVNYFQDGATAMSHTESQLQFINNKAAMIFCGLWLHNEMKESTPPDFEMRCFNIPAVEGGKGNPKLFNGSGWEYAFVPADARHPEEVMDFIRYLVSPANAPDMGASIGVISPLTNGTPRDAVAPPLQSALDLIEAGEGIFNLRLDSLLLSWRTQVMEPAMDALLRGAITPLEFCERLEAGVQAAKADPDAIIPAYTPINPADFGEAI